MLEVENLSIALDTDKGPRQVVQNVGFYLEQGKIFGMAGSSGAGKTLTVCAVSGLLAKPARMENGRIRLSGKDIPADDRKVWRKKRGRDIFMIFQDAASALNPVLPIGEQIIEVLVEVKGLSRSRAKNKAASLLEDAGVAASRLKSFPFQLSGGMRRRVQIAIALALKPKVLIADEPTTGLDAITRMDILHLLRHLAQAHGTAVLFISHDLSVIAWLADRIGIMHRGRLVETGKTDQIFKYPKHPQTRYLCKYLSYF